MNNAKLSNIFTVAAVVFASFTNLNAKTVYTSKVTTGNWNNAASWTKTGDGNPVIYIVKNGHTINLNVNGIVDTLYIYGTFSFNSNRDLTLSQNGAIIVDGAGILKGGSANSDIIFPNTTFKVSGPFNGNKLVTDGPRYANRNTVIAASGATQASFVFTLTALPVVLSSIEVTNTNNSFNLLWTALGESNMNNFIVETSTNGRIFTTVTTVNGGSENNQGFYDASLPKCTTSFYVRLSEVNNGVTTVLAVKYVKVENINTNTFNLFPNLIQANSNTEIKMVLPAAGNYKVQILTLNAQVVANDLANTNSENEMIAFNTINWNLATGQYVVIVTGNNGQVYKSRILVK